MERKLLLKMNANTGLTSNRWSMFICACMMLIAGQNVLAQDAPHAGEIVGGPFAFCVDGTPDMVSGLSLKETVLDQ